MMAGWMGAFLKFRTYGWKERDSSETPKSCNNMVFNEESGAYEYRCILDPVLKAQVRDLENQIKELKEKNG